MAENGLSAFHYLSIVSAISISLGVLFVLIAQRTQSQEKRAGWFFGHFKFMSWSYVGLVAAGAAQISARIAVGYGGGLAEFWWAVMAGSGIVILIGMIMINRFAPTVKQRYRAHPKQADGDVAIPDHD